MRLRNGNWYWKRGPLEVEINSDSFGWHTMVSVFGQVVAEEWRRAASTAANYATGKLAQIERALLAPRPVGRMER